MERTTLNHIVIVGGGTAGWMAAITLSAQFPEKRITVVDSTAIGPIGVGESVTGVVLEFVTDPLHGLSVGEFFRRTGATFKLGIWYQDWHGPGTEYLGPIDFPPHYFKHHYETHSEEFYAAAAADGIRLGEAQLYGQLMRKGCTDHFRNADGTINTNHAHASCHFEAVKFAEWLRHVVTQRPGVRHYDDLITGFAQDAETGHVTKIHTRDGREIEGDFFIDCTGFHRLLFAKACQPEWRSYERVIKVDSAIPQMQEFTPGRAIPNYTLARAMPHGWQWQIPTQARLGKGYIFSSRYVSDEQAIAEFRATGVGLPENPRILRFQPGRFAQQWIGNVCAIGLSGVFSEPLEATTIHGMSVQMKLLTKLLLPYASRAALPPLAAQYNQLVGAAYDDYVDFINFHYHTGRADTEFWRDYQKPDAMTPANQFRLEKWKYAFPTREDFAPTYTQQAALTTGLPVWAPMLCAMGHLRKETAQRLLSLSRHRPLLQENTAQYLKARNRILQSALTQAEAIHYLRALP